MYRAGDFCFPFFLFSRFEDFASHGGLNGGDETGTLARTLSDQSLISVASWYHTVITRGLITHNYRVLYRFKKSLKYTDNSESF